MSNHWTSRWKFECSFKRDKRLGQVSLCRNGWGMPRSNDWVVFEGFSMASCCECNMCKCFWGSAWGVMNRMIDMVQAYSISMHCTFRWTNTIINRKPQDAQYHVTLYLLVNPCLFAHVLYCPNIMHTYLKYVEHVHYLSYKAISYMLCITCTYSIYL